MTAAPDSPARSTAPTASWLVGALGVGLVALWLFTPLETLLDRRLLANLARVIASSPAAPAIVVAAFVAGGLVLFPITPLLAATALVFSPGRALAFGLAGALSSAVSLYAIGRDVGRRRPGWLEGPRLAPVREKLRRRGVIALATLRLVPVGSFSVSNMAAGALEIPFRDYLLGNALGLLPVLLALTVLSRELRGLGWLAP